MGSLGQLAPTVAGVIASGGVGGVIARQAAKRSIANYLKKNVGKEVSQKATANILRKAAVKGQMAGAGAGAMGMETGEIYGDVASEGFEGAKAIASSIAGGVAAGSLDVLPVMRIAKQFGFAGGLTKAMQSKYAEMGLGKRIGSMAASQAGFEAVTEGLQTVIEEGTKAYIKDTDMPDDLRSMVLNAAAAGAVGGFAMGGIGGVPRPAPPRQEIDLDQIQDKIINAPDLETALETSQAIVDAPVEPSAVSVPAEQPFTAGEPFAEAGEPVTPPLDEEAERIRAIAAENIARGKEFARPRTREELAREELAERQPRVRELLEKRKAEMKEAEKRGEADLEGPMQAAFARELTDSEVEAYLDAGPEEGTVEFERIEIKPEREKEYEYKGAVEFEPGLRPKKEGLELEEKETAEVKYEGGLDFEPSAPTPLQAEIESNLDATERLERRKRIDALGEELKDVALPPNVTDARLKRKPYRIALKSMSEELQEGGGQAMLMDERGKVTERTPSVNPEWFKNWTDSPSVADVKKAVDKALKGERLGDRQARTIDTMLGAIADERAQGIQYTQDQRKARDQLKKIAGEAVKVPQGEYKAFLDDWYVEEAGRRYDESEYTTPKYDADARAIEDLVAEARQYSGFEAEIDSFESEAKGLSDKDQDSLLAKRLFSFLERAKNEPAAKKEDAIAREAKAGAEAEETPALLKDQAGLPTKPEPETGEVPALLKDQANGDKASPEVTADIAQTAKEAAEPTVAPSATVAKPKYSKVYKAPAKVYKELSTKDKRKLNKLQFQVKDDDGATVDMPGRDVDAYAKELVGRIDSLNAVIKCMGG
jgi:hypothetical protein